MREAIWSLRQNGREIENREALKVLRYEIFSDISRNLLELLNYENVELSSKTLIVDVIRSTHLITEGVSIIAYWATTGKPILVVRDSNTPQFNDEGRLLVEKLQTGSNVEEISDWVSKVVFQCNPTINEYIVDLFARIHPTFDKSPFDLLLEVLTC